MVERVDGDGDEGVAHARLWEALEARARSQCNEMWKMAHAEVGDREADGDAGKEVARRWHACRKSSKVRRLHAYLWK